MHPCFDKYINIFILQKILDQCWVTRLTVENVETIFTIIHKFMNKGSCYAFFIDIFTADISWLDFSLFKFIEIRRDYTRVIEHNCIYFFVLFIFFIFYSIFLHISTQDSLWDTILFGFCYKFYFVNPRPHFVAPLTSL